MATSDLPLSAELRLAAENLDTEDYDTCTVPPEALRSLLVDAADALEARGEPALDDAGPTEDQINDWNTAYGQTKSGTVVHLLDDARGFGGCRARCGVHLDRLIPPIFNEAHRRLIGPACSNCAAVLPMGRPSRG